MRILTYRGKLVEEIGYVTNEKVCFLRYVKEEDKEKCPHCNKPIDKQITIVENCRIWNEDIRGVDSLIDKNK